MKLQLHALGPLSIEKKKGPMSIELLMESSYLQKKHSITYTRQKAFKQINDLLQTCLPLLNSVSNSCTLKPCFTKPKIILFFFHFNK
jgi:hypothetical protein